MNTGEAAPEPREDTSQTRRALLSLDGLSLGDAFGEMMSARARNARQVVASGQLPPGPWWHTDDTQMSLAIVEVLNRRGAIDPDALAQRFATRFAADPGRGYGKGARMILSSILDGMDWQTAASRAFSNEGSKGNGSAMRVAPLGAWFADDFDRLITEARTSSIVTHSHSEGVAGAVAVAIAAASAWRERDRPVDQAREKLWKNVLERTPEGETRTGLQRAANLPIVTSAGKAAQRLGSGYLVTAPDTVPFAIWCAVRHLDDYREAMLSTLEGDGDCDTNCAIVGGIVALFAGNQSLPAAWLNRRESLDLEL